MNCYLHLQAHTWFETVDWDTIFDMDAAFVPEVNDDLDTQNFEKFDEVTNLLSHHISFGFDRPIRQKSCRLINSLCYYIFGNAV